MQVTTVLVLAGVLFAGPAQAQCAGGYVGPIACGETVSGQLDPGPWIGAAPVGNSCPNGFDFRANDIGRTCNYNQFGNLCAGKSCSGGSNYFCGQPLGNQPQDGPDDAYAFLCPATGVVQVDLTNTDCDLDLYILDSTCNPGSGCVAGADNGQAGGESLLFGCIGGQAYTLVVEGWGFTGDGNVAYGVGGGLSCASHLPGLKGFYDLTVTSCPSSPEDCFNGIDDDGDGLTDCFDVLECPGSADVCDGVDNDCDGLIDGGDTDSDGVGDVCDPCPIDPFETDLDGDGAYSCDDCDDNDPFANNDDNDGDGFSNCQGDCADNDPNVSQGLPELADGIDNDCDGAVDEGTANYDDDGDGFAENGGDCNDGDPLIFPGGVEDCDGQDEDCDLVIDNDTACVDDDNDGFSENQGDCNDGDPNVNPGEAEIMGNLVDDDCDDVVDDGTNDPDDDGYLAPLDCDPGDGDVFPGAPEIFDGQDNDCDGVIDEDTLNYDDDGDGMSEFAGDCNDDDANTYEGAPELADYRDNDCDGEIDEGTINFDDDGDGASENGGDCNDSNLNVYPGALEVANGVDDDCDGQIDEGLDDLDGDGWGVAEDCDDNDGWVHPQAVEFCDDIDNDCNDVVDDDCDDDGSPSSSKGGAAGGCSCASTPEPAWFALLVLPLIARRRS